jgi:hypothetical protein
MERPVVEPGAGREVQCSADQQIIVDDGGGAPSYGWGLSGERRGQGYRRSGRRAGMEGAIPHRGRSFIRKGVTPPPRKKGSHHRRGRPGKESVRKKPSERKKKPSWKKGVTHFP